MNKLIDSYRQLLNIIENNSDVSKKIAESVFLDNNFRDSPDKLEELIEEKQKEGCHLNIGILGKVKAGKSSLLNSMFFKGESILPKAATPMTAALTIISYGEDCSAEIEFYSKEDLQDIKNNHDEYIKRYNELYRDFFDNEIEKNSKRRHGLTEEQISKNSKINAENRIKSEDERLVACYEQFKKIKESVYYDEFINGKNSEIISGLEPEELISRLKESVGANGKYMPFTKMVILKLPIEELKDIEIVDTPGLDDPIISRSQRTEDYLSSADVVFIISPANHFLDIQDQILMNRLCGEHGEGIREIFFVASQFDNALHGIEVVELSSLTKAISHVKDQTIEDKASVIQDFFKDSGISLGDKNVEYRKRVFIASGIASSLLHNWETPENWKEEEKKVFDYLKTDYPNDFSDDISSKKSLQLLNGIDQIKEKVKEIRTRKQEIQKEKLTHFLEDKKRAFENSLTKIIEELTQRKIRINSTDISAIKEQKKQIEKLKLNASVNVDDAYDSCVDNFRINLKKAVDQNRELYIKETTKESYAKQTSEVRSVYSHSTGWWLWKKDHYVDKEIDILFTGQVKALLNVLLSQLSDSLSTETDNAKSSLKKQLKKDLSQAIENSMENSGAQNIVEVSLIRSVINSCINLIEIPDFDLSDLTYRKLTPDIDKFASKIEGSSVSEFLSTAEIYMSQLKQAYSSYTNKQIKQILDKLKNTDSISASLFKDINERISKLEEEILNKEEVTLKIDNCLKELEALKNDSLN